MDLKECPFCGGDASWMIQTKEAYALAVGITQSSSMNTVECNCCGCTTPSWFSKEKAIEAWNKRSTATGIKDRKGVEIFEGDKLRFADKWEWYKGEYGIKIMFAAPEEKEKLMAQYEAEPYEERIVSLPEDYEWLLSGEIQSYWEVTPLTT